MGYDDRHYPGGAPPDGDYIAAPRTSRWGASGGSSWVMRIRAAVGLMLALPIVLQVLILVVNYGSSSVGCPLDLPPLITWAEAARLLRDALSALALGGY